MIGTILYTVFELQDKAKKKLEEELKKQETIEDPLQNQNNQIFDKVPENVDVKQTTQNEQ